MEEWKTFKEIRKTNLTRIYEVSTEGRIRVNGEIKQPSLNNVNGYLTIAGKYVHRLVAELFLENPDGKPHVDHKNTNRQDNRVTNLQWVTCKENHNNYITRFLHHGHKQTDATKRKISEKHKEWWQRTKRLIELGKQVEKLSN